MKPDLGDFVKCSSPACRSLAKAAWRSSHMGLGVLTWIVAAVSLASIVPPVAAQGDYGAPLRKLELNKFTCEELAAVPHRMVREGILVYMNGYVDGTQKAQTWDAEVAGKRIDEAMRLCTANPKSTVLDAFKRAWTSPPR
jgi:hypothetical protein